MRLFGWIRRWRESTAKLRELPKQISKGIADLAEPIKCGTASDTQIAASIASLNQVADTVKMQWPDTVRRTAK